MQGDRRPYQGYPYINPIVTDVPSIGPEVASRWADLPRRPLVPVRKAPGFGLAVPKASGVQTNTQAPQAIQGHLPSKRDPDPVVYIDLPQNNGSEVAQNMEVEQNNSNDFVQETIMYDPFENRRIDLGKQTSGPDSTRSSISGASSAGHHGSSAQSPTGAHSSSRFPDPQVHQGSPRPPNTLDLSGIGPSSSSSSNSKRHDLPTFLANETNVYGGDYGFASPVAGGAFPEPPPAYSESDTLGRPRDTPQSVQGIPDRVPESPERVQDPQTVQQRPQWTQERPPWVPQAPPPPRTIVVTTTDTPSRKYLTCHHCGLQGHSLVVRGVGFLTHVVALICFLVMLPLVVLVYCTDTFKHKNHYCPYCNKLIGFTHPLLGKKIHYVD